MTSYELKDRTDANNGVQVSREELSKDRDNAELAHVGKKPVLKVCLSIAYPYSVLYLFCTACWQYLCT